MPDLNKIINSISKALEDHSYESDILKQGKEKVDYTKKSPYENRKVDSSYVDIEKIKLDPYFPYYSPTIHLEDYIDKVYSNIIIFDFHLRDNLADKIEKTIELVVNKCKSNDLLMIINNDPLLSSQLFTSLDIIKYDSLLKKIRNFVLGNSSNTESVSLFDIFKQLEDTISNIYLPNTISYMQLVNEKNEYINKCKDIAKKEKDERINKILSSINVGNEDNDNKSVESKNMITVKNSLLGKKFFKIFKPSNRVAEIIIKNIFIISCNDTAFSKTQSIDFSETQKIIKKLKSKGSLISIYPICKKYVEEISAMGFDSIELLYDDYT